MAHIIKGLSRLITLGLVLPVVVLMMVAAKKADPKLSPATDPDLDHIRMRVEMM